MVTFTLSTNNGKKYKFKDSDEIHRGGEGKILSIDSEPGLVAKIYHQGVIPITEEKYQFLSKLNKNLFVVPIDLLFDTKKEIAGFTMEYIERDFFPFSAILSINFCKSNDITDSIKQNIAKKMIQAVEYAHNNQLVIGDLNQYNILTNKNGEIKFIDTDSYETPNQKHTGVLLDDIRDYLYSGQVSKNSDYFALSVLLFYSFTYAHPFKGIHKVYKKLSDRMILKIPIFATDPDLVQPKVYQPITDNKLQNQFEKIYLEGNRFLINLQGISTLKTLVKPVTITKISQKDLAITTILQHANIRNIFFLKNCGYIETDENFLIYNTKNKGYLTSIFTVSKSNYDKIYISDENILAKKADKLFHYKSDANIVEIKNFTFSKESFTLQLGDIMTVISEDVMYNVYLSEIVNNSIQIKRTEIFGKSFSTHTGLFQNTGGIFRFFFNSGKDIASVKSDKKIKEIRQTANIGIIRTIENNAVTDYYFKISGLNIEFSKEPIENLFDFGYMPIDKDNGFIFEPGDNFINIKRTQDFNIISSLECNLISELSNLQYTNAGIIAFEGDSVYLLNKI